MKTNNKAVGTILSASCMTDMPAFYPNELIQEVEKRRNKGQLIHTLVIWTKHPKSLLVDPLYSYLNEIRNAGIQLYIQLTITGMGGLQMGVDLNGNPIVIEPHGPKWEDAVAELPKVIGLVGNPLRIRLRIDPLLRFKDAVGNTHTNMDYLPKIIEATAPLGIKTYNISFVEDKDDDELAKGHVKVNKRFEKLGAVILPPTIEERAGIKVWMDELSNQNGIRIYSCATPGMEKSSCINGAWLEQLHDSHMPTSHRECPSRALCGCTESIDIGGWPPKTCYTGCLYCYAKPYRD